MRSPVFLNHSGEGGKVFAVYPQLCQGLRTFGAEPVLDVIIGSIVDHHKIVPILQHDLCSLCYDLLRRIIYEVVHIPLKIDMGKARIFMRHYDRLLAGSDQRVEDGVQGQDRLFVFLNAVDLRLCAGVHGGKADRCHRGHYGLHGQLQLRVRFGKLQKVGIFFVQPLANGIGIVHKYPVCLLTA